jgi:hypothetical protein
MSPRDEANAQPPDARPVQLVELTLAPSHGLAVAMLLVSLLSAVPLWVAGIDSAIAVGATFAVLLHGAWFGWRYALLGARRSVVRMMLGRSSSAVLVLRDGSTVAGTIEPSTVVTGPLVALALRVRRSTRVDGSVIEHSRWRARMRHVIVVPGMLDADDLRRLRVMLRWGISDGVHVATGDGTQTGLRPGEQLLT